VVPVAIFTGLAMSACIVGLLAIGGSALWKAASNCPPADFPRYAGSAQTSFNVNVGTVTECDAEFTAPADVVAVTGYMRTQLDKGDWQLVSTDDAQGVLTFQRRSKSSTTGQVQLLGQGDHALVQVQILNA